MSGHADGSATFMVTLPGPHADEWTAEVLQQDIMEAYGLADLEVSVKRV